MELLVGRLVQVIENYGTIIGVSALRRMSSKQEEKGPVFRSLA